jgi:leucyl aminopeptidase
MLEQNLDCLIEAAEATRPLHAVRPAGLAAFLDSLPEAQSNFLRQLDFTAEAQELRFLPAKSGVAGAVLGLGDDKSPAAFGNLALRLPEGEPWQLQPGDYDPAIAVLGFCLGAYCYGSLKSKQKRAAAKLLVHGDQVQSRSAASATWMVRDLINTPANLLGPVELAEFTISLGQRYGATTELIADDPLESGYPTVAMVGRGSARPPRVAILHWSGSKAHAGAPLLSLCGKGSMLRHWWVRS